MLDEDTFEAMRALHIVFAEATRGDFSLPQEEPPVADIETYIQSAPEVL